MLTRYQSSQGDDSQKIAIDYFLLSFKRMYKINIGTVFVKCCIHQNSNNLNDQVNVKDKKAAIFPVRTLQSDSIHALSTDLQTKI